MNTYTGKVPQGRKPANAGSPCRHLRLLRAFDKRGRAHSSPLMPHLPESPQVLARIEGGGVGTLVRLLGITHGRPRPPRRSPQAPSVSAAAAASASAAAPSSAVASAPAAAPPAATAKAALTAPSAPPAPPAPPVPPTPPAPLVPSSPGWQHGILPTAAAVVLRQGAERAGRAMKRGLGQSASSPPVRPSLSLILLVISPRGRTRNTTHLT